MRRKTSRKYQPRVVLGEATKVVMRFVVVENLEGQNRGAYACTILLILETQKKRGRHAMHRSRAISESNSGRAQHNGESGHARTHSCWRPNRRGRMMNPNGNGAGTRRARHWIQSSHSQPSSTHRIAVLQITPSSLINCSISMPLAFGLESEAATGLTGKHLDQAQAKGGKEDLMQKSTDGEGCDQAPPNLTRHY
ncbi:hypothetical protein VNO77_26859 [Canavalia gladiata]|uniref:Uncharacterized protein n=1 Tax=Canavalia gladiata TaxID=3824 RepID=A0AAN9Q5Z1_CANGL